MTPRQIKYLKLIIDSYIEDGIPVASSSFIKKYKIEVSPATIRNEMNFLEKQGFLEKQHTSGGRIPSIKGYQYYATHLTDKGNLKLRNKLKDIFAKRRATIDFTIDEAAKAISMLAGLTMVTSSSKVNETLKSIQLTPLNKNASIVVIVTSSGKVESKLLDFNDKIKIDDVRIAIRLFKERLIDTNLREIPLKIESLSTILAEKIKNHEDLIQAFVTKIFDFHEKIVNKVYGNDQLIKSEIERNDLANLIDLIEEKSIWSSIEGQLDEDETMKIDVRPNNTSIISKKISSNNFSKEISIVGPNRMKYSDAKQAIKLLEEFLKGEDK